MLAGLLFAVQDSEDRHGALTATLPFAGFTLIEYQARLVIAAGASQIVVVVARLTPELLGAVARIGRRGITVDTVRTAAEANAKLHPLSHLLVLADGLLTTDAIIAPLAQDGGDALLVVPELEAPATLERLGGGVAWAGAARSTRVGWPRWRRCRAIMTCSPRYSARRGRPRRRMWRCQRAKRAPATASNGAARRWRRAAGM